jgi:hypothetical protein
MGTRLPLGRQHSCSKVFRDETRGRRFPSPFLYKSCTIDFMPVYPGALENREPRFSILPLIQKNSFINE